MSTISTAITIVTAIASVMSVIGSGFILVCYTILPLDYHFRHVLILNLAISGEELSYLFLSCLMNELVDFLNSLNNSIAGLYILSNRTGSMRYGPACVLNGLVGQITVQVRL
jgi:hypothetical protein